MTNWWDSDKVESGDPYNVTPGAARGVSGEDYLKLLPPEMAGTTRGLAHYKIDPGSLSTKGGHRERMLGAAMRYDPEYDQAAYKARAAAIKEFTSGGPASPAAQITAGNTALQHLKSLLQAAEDLKQRPEMLQSLANQDIRVISPLAAKLQNATIEGTSKGVPLVRFRDAGNHYSEEVTKFYSAGGGSEAEKSRALRVINPDLSIHELRAALREEAELMSGKVNELQDRYKTALGPKAWLTALEGGIPKFPVLRAKTEDALKHIYEKTAPAEPGAADAGGAASAPASQSAQPAAQPPVPNAKQAPDGKWYVPDPNRAGKYLMVQ